MPFLAIVARVAIFAKRVVAVQAILSNFPRYFIRAVFRYAARNFGLHIRTKFLTYLKNKAIKSKKLRKLFSLFRKIRSKFNKIKINPKNIAKRILKNKLNQYLRRQKETKLRYDMIKKLGVKSFKDLMLKFRVEAINLLANELMGINPPEVSTFLPRPKRTHKLSRSIIGKSYTKKLKEVLKTVEGGKHEKDSITDKNVKQNFMFAKFKSSWLKMGIYNIKKRKALFFMKGNRSSGWYVFHFFPKFIFQEMINNTLNFSLYGAGTILWAKYWGRWGTIHKRYLFRTDLIGRRSTTPKIRGR